METVLTKSPRESFVEAWQWELDEPWQDWFSDDANVRASSSDELPELLLTEAVGLMLETGETMWEHLGWVKQLINTFQGWMYDGFLIKARLLAEWALSTMPHDLIDPDVQPFLMAISHGQFCDAYGSVASPWPNTTEYYLQHLNYRMLPYALDDAMEYRAMGNVLMLRQFQPELFAD